MNKKQASFYQRYPPSVPCSCKICLYFCNRPGWWLVSEARLAIENGLSQKMMLEFSPDFTFAVLSPAFKGNESYFALQLYSKNKCTFLQENRCSIYNKPFQPAECRFCHHERIGQGKKCHIEIGHDWNTKKGKRLIKSWLLLNDLRLPPAINIF